MNTISIQRKPEISIVMPVFNGENYIEESIRRLVNYLNRINIAYEIIVVDDGSTDATYQAILKCLNKRVKLIRYRENRGKGFAFIKGTLKSRGNIVFLFDSDLDIPPSQIGILLATIRRKNVDMVITNKWHPLSKTIASPTRKFLSIAFNALVRLLTGLKLQDTQTGAKAFKRKPLIHVIKYMYVKRYAFDVELLLVAQKLGYRILDVPSVGTIKLTSRFKLREIVRMCLELLSITYRHRIMGGRYDKL